MWGTRSMIRPRRSVARRRSIFTTMAYWKVAAIHARMVARSGIEGAGAVLGGGQPTTPALIQLEMQRVMPVLERSEQIGDVRVIHRLAGIVGHEVLFAHIGDVVTLLVLGQQVIERLFLRGTAVFGYRGIPFLGIRELRVNVKDNTAERVFLVTDHLAQVIFRACFNHNDCAPITYTRRCKTGLSNHRLKHGGNSL